MFRRVAQGCDVVIRIADPTKCGDPRLPHKVREHVRFRRSLLVEEPDGAKISDEPASSESHARLDDRRCGATIGDHAGAQYNNIKGSIL